MSRYVPVSLKAKVRERFANCCGYCQTAERLTTTQFEIEHILPRSRSGETTFENLCLACSFCNLLKSDRIEFIDPITGDRTPIFHPQQQVWTEHFAWEQNGSSVIGKTAIGRAAVAALQMNREALVNMREMWVFFGQHPPDQSVE
jgi:HNH endonuclease